jgi:hypothetical protein
MDYSKETYPQLKSYFNQGQADTIVVKYEMDIMTTHYPKKVTYRTTHKFDCKNCGGTWLSNQGSVLIFYRPITWLA